LKCKQYGVGLFFFIARKAYRNIFCRFWQNSKPEYYTKNTHMKIEQLLSQYLYENKEMQLQGIGTFQLSPDYVLPGDNDKDFSFPENAITFRYDKKAPEDEGLINFIVQKTRKIKPLASADLDSFLMLGKQFVNIGKPFKIEGVGTLQKNMQGEFDFVPGHFVNARAEAPAASLKEKAETDISFNTANKARGSKKLMYILATVLLLGVLGTAAWYFLNRKDKDNDVVENTGTKEKKTAKASTDTLVSTKPTDTGKVLNAVNSPSAPIVNTGAYTFKIVIKDAPKEVAEQRYNKLLSYNYKNLMLYTKDSITYKVAIPFSAPLSDTLKMMDSLRVLFGGKPYCELN
jgi:hypothetical protein